MKICIDLTSLYDKLSGIEKFTLMISKNMIENDRENSYELIFWKEVHKDFKAVIQNKNVVVHIIKTNSKLVMSQLMLPIKLMNIKADRYLFMAFPSPLLFRKKGIVNAIHDMTPWLYPETMSKKGLLLFKILISNAIKVSKNIVTVSNSSKEDIEMHFGKLNNIHVIYNGVDDIFNNFSFNAKLQEEINVKYKLPSNYILSLGTLEPRKNFKILLEAYIELRKKGEVDTKLVIVGRKGWKYSDFFNNLDENISEYIIFTGFVETEHLPYIYKNSNVFAFPSLYEGFGIPVIEASAMGSLVLASDIKVLKEILEDNALFFESNNKEDLKVKLLEALNCNSEIIKNKLKENSKKYNWKREAEKMLDIIERI